MIRPVILFCVFNFSVRTYSPRLLLILQFHVFPFNNSSQNVISAHALRHIFFLIPEYRPVYRPVLTIILVSFTTAWRSTIVERNLTALKFVVSGVVKTKKTIISSYYSREIFTQNPQRLKSNFILILK
jgi:hypothetical protein